MISVLKLKAKKRQIRKPNSVTQNIGEQKGEAMSKVGKQLGTSEYPNKKRKECWCIKIGKEG